MKTLALAVLFSGVIVAQPTWNDLRFGMTEEQAREALAKNNMKMRDSGAVGIRTFVVEPHYEVKSTSERDANLRVFFEPKLSFEANGLRRIDLSMNLDKAQRDRLELVTGEYQKYRNAMVIGSSAPVVYQLLLGKYGKPVQQSGTCEVSSAMDLIDHKRRCEVTWKEEGQSINMIWEYLRVPTSRQSVSLRFRHLHGQP